MLYGLMGLEKGYALLLNVLNQLEDLKELTVLEVLDQHGVQERGARVFPDQLLD